MSYNDRYMSFRNSEIVVKFNTCGYTPTRDDGKEFIGSLIEHILSMKYEISNYNNFSTSRDISELFMIMVKDSNHVEVKKWLFDKVKFIINKKLWYITKISTYAYGMSPSTQITYVFRNKFFDILTNGTIVNEMLDRLDAEHIYKQLAYE
jgi:hypothetical protein